MLREAAADHGCPIRQVVLQDDLDHHHPHHGAYPAAVRHPHPQKAHHLFLRPS